MTLRRRRGGDEGIALLIVLLAITLLTIVVIEFTDAAQVETLMALSARNALQATYLARSGVNVAESMLLADGAFSIPPGSKSNDSVRDLWAGPFPPLPIGDGTVAFRVRDEARFLNLNDMFSKDGHLQEKSVAVFRRLFTHVLGVDERILWAIIDWIDEDPNAHVAPIGAEQPQYLGLTPPVLVRNGPLLTLRELLLVRGVTPTILAKLEDFVTVLPRSDRLRVNVNTAPAEVLSVLSETMLTDPSIVERLIAGRNTEAFTQLSEVKDIPGLFEALDSSTDLLATSSDYFRIEAVAQMNDVHRGIIEVVKRDGGKRVSRITWTPSSATVALTSQPPSDFLATLPPLGDS